MFLACEKQRGERGELLYMGIMHILRGGGRLCGDIARIGILHIFSDINNFPSLIKKQKTSTHKIYYRIKQRKSIH